MPEPEAKVCANCDQLTRRPQRGLCSPCYMYQRRHEGATRPPELQRKQVGRLIERERGANI